MENNEKKQGINLEIKSEIANGSYSNLAIITHSFCEFIIDFATMLPGMPKPEITNRMIMTPAHAKRLLAALSDNIQKFEAQFGTIDTGASPEQAKNTFNLSDFNPGSGTKS